ncbi:MAG: DUF2497 domain-containing protein [Pseudomonadota bacterium]
MAATQAELSMDEILASIRRIIHEEEAPPPVRRKTSGNTVALQEQRSAAASAEPNIEPQVKVVDPASVKPMNLPELEGETVSVPDELASVEVLPEPAPESDPVPRAEQAASALAKAASPMELLAEAPAELRDDPAEKSDAPDVAIEASRPTNPSTEQAEQIKPTASAETRTDLPEQANASAENVQPGETDEPASATVAAETFGNDVETTAETADADPENTEAQTLLSDAALDSAAAAFASLRQSVQVSAQSPVTIEGMVEDMLRPMLKAWLDENLPAIVERKVQDEIKRLRDVA